jgi:hypothetical protein
VKGGLLLFEGEKGLGEQEKAREKLREGLYEAVSFLFEVLNDADAKTEHRIKAAGEIIDRGLGNPKQDETPIGGTMKIEICDLLDIAGV